MIDTQRRKEMWTSACCTRVVSWTKSIGARDWKWYVQMSTHDQHKGNKIEKKPLSYLERNLINLWPKTNVFFGIIVYISSASIVNNIVIEFTYELCKRTKQKNFFCWFWAIECNFVLFITIACFSKSYIEQYVLSHRFIDLFFSGLLIFTLAYLWWKC